jgi:hypothetical protein
MLSDSFEVDLRTALQVQADLLCRIEQTTVGVEHDFDESRIAPGEISAVEAAVSALEAEATLLEAGDLADFDPEEIPRIYDRRRAEVSTELVRIGYRGWDHFVRQTHTFALTHGLDPLAPFDTFLIEGDLERLQEESYESSLLWDRWDYFFVYGSGMLAALTDFLLVRIPKMMVGGQYAGQEGSPLTEWFKQYDTRPGHSEGWLAEWARMLEESCKTPYDRQAAVLDGELAQVPGMTAKSHRLQTLGHDPVFGFVFGVLDILRGTVTAFSYDHLAGAHRYVEGKVFSPLPTADMDERVTRLIEAILRHMGHLISDVATPMGLPAPLMTLFQALSVGSFGEKDRTVGQLARWMYLNGYDLRHFVASGVTPAVIEIVLRAYVMLRHYSELGEVKLAVAQSPKYRSMLLAAHGVAAAANAGKVALYQGNPLAINQAEWMALLRYLFPHMKYWMFDRQRLKLEHMARINEAGWDELALSSGRVLERVAAEDWEIIRLGRAEAASV